MGGEKQGKKGSFGPGYEAHDPPRVAKHVIHRTSALQLLANGTGKLPKDVA